jgi:GT2 family glycosyltransferase/SAM-dependent methyltransferase
MAEPVTQVTAQAVRCPTPGCGGTVQVLLPERRHERLPESSFELLVCAGCGLAFVDPQPTAGQLARLYESYPYHASPSLAAVRASARKLRVARLLTNASGDPNMAGSVVEQLMRRGVSATLAVPSHMDRSATVLDFGFGDGSWLLAMAELGFSRLFGFDLGADGERTEALADRGVRILREPLEAAAASGDLPGFDLVHLAHVFEHLPDPAAELARLYRLLAPGGMLAMVMPSIAAWEPLGELPRSTQLDHLQLPMHLFHHSPSSLRAFLVAAGFEVLGLRLLPPHRYLSVAARRPRETAPLARPAGGPGRAAGAPAGGAAERGGDCGAEVPASRSIGVVISNYETWPLALRCVRAVHEVGGADRIVVIDDGSATPPPQELLERSELLVNSTNQGLCRSLNRAVDACDTDVVVLFDSDAYPLAPFAERLRALFASEPRLGACAFSTVGTGGRPTASAEEEPDVLGLVLGQRLDALRRRRRGDRQAAERLDVFACASAVRRAPFLAVGGFDETFDWLDLDHDLSMRLRRAGYRLAVAGDLVAFHEGGGAPQKRGERVARHYRNRWLLLRKHGKVRWPRCTGAIIGLRLLLELALLAPLRLVAPARFADLFAGRWRALSGSGLLSR